MCWGDVKLCQNFHRAGEPRIQWKRNQNSSRKRSTESKSHCNENVCCAEQREMSSKGLQSLRRKATRGNENRQCTVYLAVSNVKSGSGKPQLKKTPVGVNKLNTLMKTVAQKAGFGPNFKNLSGRKLLWTTACRQLILEWFSERTGTSFQNGARSRNTDKKLGLQHHRVVLKSELAVVVTNRRRYICSWIS